MPRARRRSRRTRRNARGGRGYFYIADAYYRAIPRTHLPRGVNRFAAFATAMDALDAMDPYAESGLRVVWRDASGVVHDTRPTKANCGPSCGAGCRRTKRNRGTVTRGIARRYHDGDEMVPERRELPRPTGTSHGMGPLVWVEVLLPSGKVEKWTFRPMPRLYYDGANRLWPVGGSYKVDDRGFRNVRGKSAVRRVPVGPMRKRLRGQREKFRRTHGGLDPREAVVVEQVLPDTLTFVGWLKAVAYRADRNDGDGLVNWRHRHDEKPSGISMFRAQEMPMIYVDPEGRNMEFVGGTYTIDDGWIDG